MNDHIVWWLLRRASELRKDSLVREWLGQRGDTALLQGSQMTMKINELRQHVKQFGGWTIRTDGEFYGPEDNYQYRTVYIASKRLEDGTQVRLRNHDAAALSQVINVLEDNV